VILLYLTY